MKTFKPRNVSNATGAVVAVLCPGCSREGNFAPLGQDLAFNIDQGSVGTSVIYAGQRILPQ